MYAIVFAIVAGIGLTVVGRLFPEVVPYLLGAYAGMLVIGLFQQNVRDLLQYIAYPVTALKDGTAFLKDQSSRVQNWIQQVRNEQDLGLDSVLISRIIGTLLHATMTVIFVFSEYYLVTETLLVLHRESELQSLPIEINPDLILAIGIVCGGVVWGTIWSDLEGKTNLAPWDKLSESQQESLKRVCKLIIGSFLFVLAMLGTYRGIGMLDGVIESVNPALGAEPMNIELDTLVKENNTPINESPTPAETPDPLGEALTIMLPPSLAVLVAVSALASGWTLQAVPMFLIYGLAKLLQLALSAIALLVNLASVTLHWLLSIALGVADLLIRISELVAAPIASKLERRNNALRNAVTQTEEDAIEVQALDNSAEQDRVADPNQTSTVRNPDNREEEQTETEVTQEDEERTRNWSPYSG